jgi:hypothetical protein
MELKMELTWPIRLRIIAAAVVGFVLIGFLCWPIAKPAEPFGIVSLQNLTATELIEIIALSFLCGFIGYFVSLPYGREIGIMAVPFGLGILAIRTGSIANLMQLNADVQSRLLIFARLRFESFFWLLLVFVGFAGAIAAHKLFGKQEQKKEKDDAKEGTKASNLFGCPLRRSPLNSAIAIFGSVIIASLGNIIFAQGVRFSDEKLGSIVSQPGVGQIVFAVLVSFGIAGFLVKKVLNLGYIWPVIATAFVTTISLIIYANTSTLDYMADRWPANFFSNSIVSILPIQMVCFGTLGSICGYWAAVRYNYWRQHEI